MLRSCFCNSIPCFASDFTLLYTFDYGNCYMFNKIKAGEGAKTISKIGPLNGLSLELYVGLSGVQNMYINRGVYLEIHNSSKTPLVRYEGLKIPVGFATDVSITRSYVSKLDSPSSNCRKNCSTYTDSDSMFFKYTLKKIQLLF
jgi:hypothetical protein